MNRRSEWKNFDDEEHVFVNDRMMKYGVIKDSSTFSKTGKSLWFTIPLLFTAIAIVLAVSFTKNFLIGVIVGIPCLFVATYLIRKFVFDENSRKRLMRENFVHKESGAEYFNNVIGATQDGEILYQQSDYGFTSSYLVTFDYGSLTESTEHAERDFMEEALRPFIKNLQDNNFRFAFYDVNIRQHLSKGTLNLIEQTKKLKEGSILKVVSQLQDEACASLERSNNVEQRLYFQVFNDVTNSVKDFRKVLETNIDATLRNATQISSPHICDKSEINEFGKNYFNVASFDIDTLNRNVKELSLSKFFIIDGFIDQNGLIHRPDELEFFPQGNERVSKSFDKNNLRTKFKQRKDKEKQINQKKLMAKRQSNVRRAGNFDFVSGTAKLRQQQNVNEMKAKKQKQLDKKQQELKNKQHLQQSHAKNFEDLLQRTRDKH